MTDLVRLLCNAYILQLILGHAKGANGPNIMGPAGMRLGGMLMHL